MRLVILGAGLAGISIAYFLQKKGQYDEIILLEKESVPGGLCRSIKKGPYLYDIGPHILFSKDKEMLELMQNVLDDGKNDLVRSNQILYKGRRVQYPFENDLSKLPKEDLSYCINAFLHNPYEAYEAANMIQFFLKTFGEGITNTYLRPYNEKIWKYDPAFMDTSMVGRIPKPTKEEIQRSAAGETVPGYLHQLYFSYPKKGGIQAVPDGFLRRLDTSICRIYTNAQAVSIRKNSNGFTVETKTGDVYQADQLISTIPVPELAQAYEHAGTQVRQTAGKLRYNSIYICFVRLPYDLCGPNFAFMVPDKDIIFHRVSKMDFLGEAYHHGKEEADYMVEITYRRHGQIDALSQEELQEKVADGLRRIGFAKAVADVEFIDITKYEYAYVVYDLGHAANMKAIREYFAKEGVVLHGRFGNFEYWNMDRVLRESMELGKRMQCI